MYKKKCALFPRSLQFKSREMNANHGLVSHGHEFELEQRPLFFGAIRHPELMYDAAKHCPRILKINSASSHACLYLR